MRQTRICELLEIEYPIIQGAMNWVANGELAGTVSEAGGLGIVTPGAAWDRKGAQADNLRLQIARARERTSKPFGVNLTVLEPESRAFAEIVASEGVPIVTTSAGNPATLTPFLKEKGIKVLHVVASCRHARGAERAGVDAVVAEGYEAGGHNGMDEIPTFALVPQVVDAVNVPVVAAGGIADGRGLVAALALGAEGVQMGTRFIATTECCSHPSFKEAVLRADDAATVITGRKIGPTRGIRNTFTDRMLEMEATGASPDDLQQFIGLGRSPAGQLDGDTEQGELYCGAVAGLVKGIVSAGDVVREMVREADELLARLASMSRT
jgi:enoyl-[acyl-carrier protein] reductase II